LLAFFSSFAGDGGCHRRRGREEEKRLRQILLFSSACGGAWVHAPPVAVARARTRRHCSGLQKGFPAISGFLGNVFFNFLDYVIVILL
jgi:hypothetical protein